MNSGQTTSPLPILNYSTTAESSAGELTISAPNDSSIDHNIAITEEGIDEVGPLVKDGGVSTIDVNVKTGTEYTYFCTVPGHLEAGMKGTLSVK